MNLRLSAKGRHPVLDTGTPLFDKSRRCRIRVRHDGIDDESSYWAPFYGQPNWLVAKYHDFISNAC